MSSNFKFTTETTAIFYNLKTLPIQQMLDFDFLCERKPSVAAIVHSGKKGVHKAFFGQKEILIPIYNSLNEATEKHPQSEVLINFASHRSAYFAAKEALETNTLKTIVIVAEGIPERQTKELIALAKKDLQNQKLIIGPSTVGGIAAGSFRIAGYAGGKMENIIHAKLYRPGSIGLVSKSGGMMNELFNIIAKTTDGIKEGVAIGGDLFPGSTLLDHLLRFESDQEIKLLVALGELGGKQEYDIIKAKHEGKLTKPLIMWVPGTCASIFPWEVQFGHAGAKAGKEEESAQFKNKALKEAGIIVPETFERLEEIIRENFQKLSAAPLEETAPKNVPLDYAEAVKQGLVRKATNITTTISSDLGEEPTYGAIPISKIVKENYSIGNLLALLWFKKKLPSYFTQFLEKSIILTADHGPAVSGAHNAIVAARAGKDVISSLCSGLLTIGPRFGGAIDGACSYFKKAVENKVTPTAFIEEMKKKSIPIPGIGHRIKSIRNPDKRVELLKEFAKQNFPSKKYLDYALEVEKITTKKAENLILNVDGCIAALFLDALESSKEFSQEEINEIIEIGYMNGLFALSRSIGIIGHVLDQKRLKEGLYRHPTEDILYLNEEKD